MREPVTTNDLLAEALRYRALGWSLIPLLPGTKRPAVKWKRFARQRPRRRELERWFSREPRNVAVVLGKVSGGLAVRDFDVREGYYDWAADHADLARQLPTARTPRGFHVYFRCHSGDPSLTRQGIAKFADGELRVRHCHVTLPPSISAEGRQYRWEQDPFDGIPIVYDPAAKG